MYGMVNQAVKSLVIEKFGEQKWNLIAEKANLKEKDFTPIDQYDDSVTGNLVGAIVEVTGKSGPEVLENFGIYWVEYSRKSEYNSILQSFAQSPVALIESLDNLHSRLQLLFPDLSAPSFWVEHTGPAEIFVHYSTSRTGMPLEYFVIGLIKGVFQMFDKSCQVVLLPGDGEEKAKFKVNY